MTLPEDLGPEPSKAAEALGDVAEVAAFGSAATTLVNSGVAGSSVSAFWSMVNALQLIHFMPLMNLHLPGNVQTMFAGLSIFNMQNVPMLEMFKIHFDDSELVGDGPINYRFSNQGFDSKSILINAGDVYSMLILYLAGMITFIVL